MMTSFKPILLGSAAALALTACTDPSRWASARRTGRSRAWRSARRSAALAGAARGDDANDRRAERGGGRDRRRRRSARARAASSTGSRRSCRAASARARSRWSTPGRSCWCGCRRTSSSRSTAPRSRRRCKSDLRVLANNLDQVRGQQRPGRRPHRQHRRRGAQPGPVRAAGAGGGVDPDRLRRAGRARVGDRPRRGPAHRVEPDARRAGAEPPRRHRHPALLTRLCKFAQECKALICLDTSESVNQFAISSTVAPRARAARSARGATPKRMGLLTGKRREQRAVPALGWALVLRFWSAVYGDAPHDIVRRVTVDEAPAHGEGRARPGSWSPGPGGRAGRGREVTGQSSGRRRCGAGLVEPSTYADSAPVQLEARRNRVDRLVDQLARALLAELRGDDLGGGGDGDAGGTVAHLAHGGSAGRGRSAPRRT